MKKLPKIYQNEINIKKKNNKEMCVVEVIIETNNNVYDTSLIFKGKNELITKENAVIKVKDIRKITIKK